MLKPVVRLQAPQMMPLYYLPADTFPLVNPAHWLTSHFAVGGWSPLQRLGHMLTAHMTQIAPHNGFTWHPHRGLEIYTWVLEGTLHHEDSVGGQGDIGPAELQRMFAGDYIEHQELNLNDDPVRVIQIWFVADPQHIGVEPHYQQLSRDQLPTQRSGKATIYNLIGDNSPMEQHMTGRLTATILEPGGTTPLVPPRPGEDLFVYFTDGGGTFHYDEPNRAEETPAHALAQYDVILARPDMPAASLQAAPDAHLHYLSFYLPTFLRS